MADKMPAEGADLQEQRGSWLLERLPPDIRARLSPEMSAAIAKAAADGGNDHSVDIRLSLPLPFRPFYLAVLAGPERRSAERRSSDRRRHLIRAANILFLIAVAVLFYAAYRLISLLAGAVLL
jgi:hypothetical protein